MKNRHFRLLFTEANLQFFIPGVQYLSFSHYKFFAGDEDVKIFSSPSTETSLSFISEARCYYERNISMHTLDGWLILFFSLETIDDAENSEKPIMILKSWFNPLWLFWFDGVSIYKVLML